MDHFMTDQQRPDDFTRRRFTKTAFTIVPRHVLGGVGLQACSGRGAAVSNFSYSGPLTETVLVGVLDQRAPGRRLEWDGAKMKIRNAPELNQYVHKPYRKGWTL